MHLYGVLKKLKAETGIDVTQLSDIIAGRKPVSWKRAKLLQEASENIGRGVEAALWMDRETQKIREILANGNGSKR